MLKTILKTIEQNGFEAYIVGGFVRDTLLKLDPIDVDICTSALEKDLMWMFKSAKGVKEYGAVKLKQGRYDIDITTFREEQDLVNGKPSSIIYTDSLDSDLKRRDFTINALCFDSDFNLIDKVNGKKDLDNKLIKVIGNTKERFDEDPFRILRALRFMTVLDFNLSKDIIDYIKNNKDKLSLINYEKRKLELDKIFASRNIYKFVSFCKKYGLEEPLGIKFKKVVKTGNSVGIWSQVEYDENYNFTKQESSHIEDIKTIINNKKIDRMTVYTYGVYESSIAGNILGIGVKKINKLYNNLQIKEINEIDITSKEICELLNIEPSEKLGLIIKKLENLIVYGKIENRNEAIKKYLIKERSKLL